MLMAAAEHGSFSAAARKLNKVQSAVSQGIANLEIDLNLQLFDRTTRKPKLTVEGERVLKFAKTIVQQSHELDKSALALQSSEERTIKFVFDNALLTPRVAAILGQFELLFPYIEVELIAIASTDVACYIGDDKADIGIMFSQLTEMPQVDFCGIGNLPFHAICHPQHPLAQLETVILSDLMVHRQLNMRGETGTQMDFFPAVSNDIWWSNNFYALYELVKSNIGWVYLPEHMVKQAVKNKTLVCLPIAFDYKPWSPPVDLIIAKRGLHGPALTWLHEQFKTVLE